MTSYNIMFSHKVLLQKSITQGIRNYSGNFLTPSVRRLIYLRTVVTTRLTSRSTKMRP